MDPGEFDTPFAIEHVKAKGDEILGVADKWEKWVDIWAQVTTLSAKENDVAEQLRASQMRRLTTYWSSELAQLTSEMRLVDETGQRYEIEAVENPGNRNELLVITATVLE